MEPIKEKYIEYQILGWLNAVGIFAWKVNVKGHYNEKKGIWQKSNNIYDFKGQPDITGVIDGKAIFIEVKRPDEDVRPEQEWFQQRLKEAGAIAIVARSLEDVTGELAKRGYKFNYQLT